MNPINSDRDLREQCFALLAANGVELDPTGREIVTFFFDARHHVTLRDIEEHLRVRGMSPDREQIVHTMTLLTDYGFAIERQFPDGLCYEHLHLGEHHDHLYCQKCGEIIEFYSPEIERLQSETAAAHGFHAFSHRLLIRGLCSKCFSGTQVIPLAAVQPGGKFRVVRVDLTGPGFGIFGAGRRRLAELGIVPGVEGEVLSSMGLGAMVVEVKGARMALGHGQSRRIMVQLTN